MNTRWIKSREVKLLRARGQLCEGKRQSGGAEHEEECFSSFDSRGVACIRRKLLLSRENRIV